MIFLKKHQIQGKTDKTPASSLSMVKSNHGGLEIIPEQEFSVEHLKELQKTNQCQKKSPRATYVIKSEDPLLKITPKEIDKIDKRKLKI